jgi:phosphoserine phosphatase RsbU/P
MNITYSYQGKERLRTIANGTVLIGRDNGAEGPDLDLSPDLYVSRKHARLTERHGAVWIEDLGSKLGTMVNGTEIKGRGEWRLHSGDLIEIGETALRVEPSPRPPRPEASAPPPANADARSKFHIVVKVEAGRQEPTFLPAARPGLELERRLALFVDLSAQLGLPMTLDALLALVLRRVMEVIPESERGAVLLRGADEGELVVKACVAPDGPAVSGRLAQRAIQEGRGFIWRGNLVPSLSGSILQHKIATGIYAPLRWQDRTLGVVCVDSPRLAAVFDSDDLRLLMAVAQYLALALSSQQGQTRKEKCP